MLNSKLVTELGESVYSILEVRTDNGTKPDTGHWLRRFYRFSLIHEIVKGRI